MPPAQRRFRLAPMSAVFWVITLVVLGLLPLFVILSLGGAPLWLGVVFLALICAGTWLTMRPSAFVVGPDGLEIVWPARRWHVARREITSARVVSARDLRPLLGFAVRVGVGGLWGTFGLLWSKKAGWVSCYVSRVDELLWIERRGARPLLLSPERPHEVARLLSPEPS
ncbi:MAG: hypothetical protein HS104_18465 [Polyangiaceae bacterium]|nr:hypothetical protein [Polyangiaceae bacterium]MCE7894004.1 hypothetical protein [Sorangiineae bacterium PRO1]MCL4753958.1 hypothetical protein [Myxococcales bacterium]